MQDLLAGLRVGPAAGLARSAAGRQDVAGDEEGQGGGGEQLQHLVVAERGCDSSLRLLRSSSAGLNWLERASVQSCCLFEKLHR